MKIRLFAVLAVLLGAFSASAALETVLTSNSVAYTIDGSVDTPRLQLLRRTSDTIVAVPVPTTEDEAMDGDARLLWDPSSTTLFVVWTRRGNRGDEIRMARLDAKGEWAEPITVASSAGVRRAGLQIVLTRAETDGEGSAKATLIHAAWWTLHESAPLAEYALVAFEAGEHVSTEVSAIDDLAPPPPMDDDSEENTGIALHPPMTMARAGSGVDVVYGRSDSTAVRRVSISPSRIVSNARAWRPLGKNGGATGRPGLISSNGAPVQAFLSKGRIVLYTPDAQFRYMVWDAGQWSPLRMIKLDESLTSEELVQQLHRTVDELVPADRPR